MARNVDKLKAACQLISRARALVNGAGFTTMKGLDDPDGPQDLTARQAILVAAGAMLTAAHGLLVESD